jgi:hypothetical protein
MSAKFIPRDNSKNQTASPMPRLGMRRRYLAALAAVGWYLMVPPLSQRSPVGFDTYAPLGRWQILGSFDKANDCEDTAARLTKSESDRLKHARMLHGNCIASDDPRLKAKGN